MKKIVYNLHYKFAIGSCLDADSRNVLAALKTADERMYEDKRLYYEKHGRKEMR